MRASRLAVALAALFVLGLGVLAAGCGDDNGNGGNGGEAGTLEEYFREMSALQDDFERRADGVEASFDDELSGITSIDDAVDAFERAIEAFEGLAEEFVRELSGITPPSEVASLHGELSQVFQDGVDALGTLLGELGDIASEDDFVELGLQVEEQFTGLEERSDDICFQLQEIADANGVDIDLECGE